MLMSQGQYATHCGVSQQAISKAVRAGKIPLVDGKIDSEVADMVWRSGRNAVSGPQSDQADPSHPCAMEDVTESPVQQQPMLEFVSPRPGSQAAEQAALARARREKLQMEMATARGEWVPLREVEQAWATMVIAVRNRIMLAANDIADERIRAQVQKKMTEAFQDASGLKVAASEVSAA